MSETIDVTAPLPVREITPELKSALQRMVSHCQQFKGADLSRSLWQLTNTLIPFFGLLYLTYALYRNDLYWIALLLSPLTSAFLVRIFIIQHDCGHRSFFNSQVANDYLGRFLSVLTWMPYDFWRRAHNMHHATSGDLDRRGVGDIDVYTVKEYQAFSPIKKMLYRIYRFPLVLLLIGPPIYLLLLQRNPWTQSMPTKKIWKSIFGLNLTLLIVYGGASLLIGFKALVAVYLPMLVLTTIIGTWMFFIQHQFEETYWEGHADWDYNEAAIFGSSHYHLPPVLKWLTGNIGLHHIHHLEAKIPNYKLPECLETSLDLMALPVLTFRESLKCIWLTLWDEEQRRLIRFKDLPSENLG